MLSLFYKLKSCDEIFIGQLKISWNILNGTFNLYKLAIYVKKFYEPDISISKRIIFLT